MNAVAPPADSDGPRPAGSAPDGLDLLWNLYDRALALPPAERAALLDRECAGRPALRRELDEMLRASSDGAALEIEAHLEGWDEATLTPGSRVGPYRVVRPLARGGMGEVYLARRTDGSYDQTVAVKLLRPGLEATGMVDRFRLERDLLARLTHPSVVPLLDGGTTAAGRPYLVLQYVEGRPLTAHCAEHGLGRRQRLRLFVALCRAVRYAHAHLVVHRDLKPSNVLVDRDGAIRLLDFGVAKLLSARPASDATRAAEPAPLTPARAAPEQLAGEPVTTATDVWALGVMLYELLAGRLPFDPEGGGVSGWRSAPPPAGAMDRDLRAIVGRALAERPDERYATAGELGDDVERWLAGEPVRARPDAAAYRARRFVGRHRVAVGLGAAAVVALAALAAVSTVQSARAVRAGERAAAEERRAKAVVELLLETFGATDPQAGAVGDEVSIGELLSRGEERAAGLDAQPEVQAALRHALGRIRLERGEYQPALVQLAAARDAELARLGEGDPASVPVRVDYARALHSNGRRADAEAELRAALAVLDTAPGHDPEVEAGVLEGLGMVVHTGEGIAMLERAVALLRATPDRDPVVYGDLLTALAVRRSMAGDPDAARALFEEARPLFAAVLGEESPRALAARSNLARLLEDPAAREAEHRAVLEIRRRALGERSYPVANSLSHLGRALTDLGRHREAEEAFRRAHAIWSERAGADHRMSLGLERDVARSLERQGRVEEAAAAFAALAERLRRTGADEAGVTAFLGPES